MELDTVHVKGKKIITRIYMPLCLKSDITDQQQQHLALHEKALEHYYNQDFQNADDLFCRLIQMNTGFEDYYRYLLQQVAAKQNMTTVTQGEIS